MSDKQQMLRNLPKVDDCLAHTHIKQLLISTSRSIVLKAIRSTIEMNRHAVLEGRLNLPEQLAIDIVISQVINEIKKLDRMNLRPTINATGVVLHTNLGRAPLAETVGDAIWQVAKGYSTLEYNTDTGQRGSRYDHIDQILTDLTGTEAAMVVNNNAAAVILVLSTLAKGKEVIVSRGELVEIGGSFRVPEIMTQSGATLVEIGTTNKTHFRDYEQAVNPDMTGALLKVHTSNYRIVGFTQDVALSDLAKISREKNIPLVHDLGCGLLCDLAPWGLQDEALVVDSVKAGADIVCFSGDKLLGGPQAGIIVGKKKYIDAMKKHPLTRAFRIDKLTLSALEATLRIYYDQERAMNEIPVLKMLTQSAEDIAKKAGQLLKTIQTHQVNGDLKCVVGQSQVGGGSMPTQVMPTTLVELKSNVMSCQHIERQLRECTRPIIVRTFNDAIYFDVRTIDELDFETIAQAIHTLLNQ